MNSHSLSITGLSRKEQTALRKMLSHFEGGLKENLAGCKVWVSEFSDERREEIYQSCLPYQRSKLKMIEGIGEGRIHPSFFGATHQSANLISSMPREEQDHLIEAGIPTLVQEGSRMIQRHFHHQEISRDQIKVAFESRGGRWHIRSRAKQKELLTALLQAPEEDRSSSRGFGAFDPERKVFIPAAVRTRNKKGYNYKELKDILKKMEEMGMG